jgi:DNA processing protein
MISTRESLRDWLRLSLTPGIGNITARALIQKFGQPEDIFQQSHAELQALVSAPQAAHLRQAPEGLDATLELTWEWLQTPALAAVRTRSARPVAFTKRVLTLADSDYPSALLRMPDPPCLLYVLGQTQHLSRLSPQPFEAPPAVAVVGSRNPTPQGLLNAHDFSFALAQAGLTVVSGLALGVDTAAHQGALEGGSDANPLRTLAIVGTGLDRVYPHQNHALAMDIAAMGLLISEYPLNTPPITSNFPKRNRLIAGLTQGCLVVEAATRSGSLITAKQAIDMGKDVFAIPGSIHITVSKGCHDLIKQGAKLVDCVQDILEELKDLPDLSQMPHPLEAPTSQPAELAHKASHQLFHQVSPSPKHSHEGAPEDVGQPASVQVLAHMGQNPVGLDELMVRTGMSAAQLQVELLQLELHGLLGRMPGGLFQKLQKMHNSHRLRKLPKQGAFRTPSNIQT